MVDQHLFFAHPPKVCLNIYIVFICLLSSLCKFFTTLESFLLLFLKIICEQNPFKYYLRIITNENVSVYYS